MTAPDAASPVRCDACGVSAVAPVRHENGATVWRCSRCGDVKRWCPRCEQGWVRRLRHSALPADVYWCAECAATWPTDSMLTPPGLNLDTLLERPGGEAPLEGAIIVQEVEGSPGAR